MIEESKYGKVHLDVSSHKTVVFLSGGLDSAVLYYLLAKQIKETRSKTNLIALTVRRGNTTKDPDFDRVDNLEVATKVTDYVKDKLGVAVKEHHHMWANYYWINREMDGRMYSSYLFAQETLQEYMMRIANKKNESLLFYNGVTMNPPKDEVPASQETHRDTKVEGHEDATVFNGFFIDVFRNADKRITIDLAKKHGILDDLLTFTRTCEGNGIDTNNFTEDCGKCWWCLEKQWALKNA